MALTPNTATGTGKGATLTLTEGYVDAVDLLHVFPIESQLFDRYNQGQTFLDFLVKTGRESEVGARTYYHYEKDWITKAQQISALGTASGDILPITIAASSLDGSNPTVARPGDLITLKNNIQAYVVRRTAYNVIEIQSTQGDNGAALKAKLAVNDWFGILGNAVAEGSTAREGVMTKPLMFSNTTQISRSFGKYTGTEMSNRTTIKVDGKEYYFYSQIIDENLRLQQGIALDALMSEGNTVTDKDGNTVKTTKGMIPSIKQNGITYAKSPVWTLQDFYNLNLIFDGERAPKELMMGYGNRLGNEIQNSLIDLTRNGGVVYNGFGDASNGQKKALELGFDTVRIGDYTYHLKGESAFNQKQTLAIPGSSMPNSAYVIPLNTSTDAKGQNIPSIQMRYKAQPNLNRKFFSFTKDIKTNGASSEDSMQVEALCDWGMEFFGLNRFAFIS
jgi:hypothetical protein